MITLSLGFCASVNTGFPVRSLAALPGGRGTMLSLSRQPCPSGTRNARRHAPDHASWLSRAAVSGADACLFLARTGGAGAVGRYPPHLEHAAAAQGTDLARVVAGGDGADNLSWKGGSCGGGDRTAARAVGRDPARGRGTRVPARRCDLSAGRPGVDRQLPRPWYRSRACP